jgi:hypothetical protein
VDAVYDQTTVQMLLDQEQADSRDRSP